MQPAHSPGAEHLTDDSRPSRRPRRGAWVRWLVSPPLLLGAMVVVFALLAVYLSLVSWAGIVNEGSGDLGVFTQAVAATQQHYPIPMYEAWDCGHTARCSFLLVHQAFVLYAFVPLFSIDPSPLSLIFAQDVLVALAAIPLYLLTRDITGSRAKALIAVALYFVWVPLLSAVVYSFHLESLLPVELLTGFWLWYRDRYVWGAVVFVLSFLTLEIAPLIVLFVGLFFLLPAIAAAMAILLPGLAQRLRMYVPPAATVAPGEPPTGRWRRVGALVRERRTWCSAALCVGAVGGYVVPRLFLSHFGGLIGIPPSPPTFHLGILQPNHHTSFSFGSVGTLLAQKLRFWLFVLVFVGFLPFLAPRSTLLLVPVFVWTLIGTAVPYTLFGYQYATVVAAPVFIGVAYGLRWMPLPGDPVVLVAGPAEWARASPVEARPRPRGLIRGARTAALLLVVVFALNIALSPLGPLAGPATTSLGPPFGPRNGAGYPLYWNAPPGYVAIERMAALIPPNATVLAAYKLYPFVARDVYAFGVAPTMNYSLLPFPTSYPEFVLMDSNPDGALPYNLSANLYTPSAYGIRAVAGNSPIGTVILFEAGYSGPIESFLPYPESSLLSFSPEAIPRGPAGYLFRDPAAQPYHFAIAQAVNATTGRLVTGPLTRGPALGDVAPGNYTLGLELNVSPVNPAAGGSLGAQPVLTFQLAALGDPLVWSYRLLYSQLLSGLYQGVEIPVLLPSPLLGAQLTISSPTTDFSIKLGAVLFQPNS